jgi:hypothetical protein
MTAIFLAAVLAIGYHYESHHPLNRLHIVRQTGYNLYFRVGIRGFQMALFGLMPSLLFVFISAVINGTTEHDLFTDKTYNDFFLTTLLCYDILFALLIMKVKLSSITKRYDGIVVEGYGATKHHLNTPEKQALYKSIMRVATESERLIIESARDLIPMRIILQSGKVYIGYPQQPDLEDGEITQLKMLPILSGYLTTKQKMVISRNYYKHYQNCYDDATGELEDNEDSGHDHITRFNIIIPIADIKVYSLFSKVAFEAIESNTEL